MSTSNFIGKIKSFEEIYNRKSIKYNNTKEKEEIWTNLSSEFNCDAKKKWIRLRDKYVRETKRLLKPSVSDESSTTQWEFYNEMNFLSDHIKPRKELAKCETMFEETIVEDCESLYNDFCTEMSTSNNFDGNQHHVDNLTIDSVGGGTEQKFKRPKVTDPVQKDLQETLKVFRNKFSKTNQTEENEEEDVFLQLVGIKMKKMSSAEKSIFQLDVLKKADEIIIKED